MSTLTPTPEPQQEQQPTDTPEFISGPAPTTTVVGILGLVSAAAVVIGLLTDLEVNWTLIGPLLVVGAGALLVVLGLVGMRGQRRRNPQ